MRVKVSWWLEVHDENVPKLVEEAVNRGCGTQDELGRRELVQRLMMDGGSNAIEETLQDPARTHYTIEN